MDKEIENSGEESPFGEVIFSYGQDEAIEDGVLVLVGRIGKERVIFTRNLFTRGYEDSLRRKALVEQGLALLLT